jgi:guanylate kinase
MDYSFVTEQRFEAMLARNELLEHTAVYGFRYGAPRWPAERSRDQGMDVLLVLDVQGRRRLAASHADDLVSVFLLPPSLDELEKRLRGRNDESDESIAGRLSAARAEIACAREYDHVLVNRDLDATLEHLDAIFRHERGRRNQCRRMVRPLQPHTPPAYPGDLAAVSE